MTETTEPLAPVGAGEQKQRRRPPVGSPVEPPPAPSPESELERLRRENEVLRGQLAAREVQTPAPPASGRRQRYRVSLEGARVRRTVFTVQVRDPLEVRLPAEAAARYQELAARSQQPEGEGCLPAAEYDGVELFEAGARPHYHAAAWERYRALHGLLATDRQHFAVRAEGRGMQDHLDVWAGSEAEAQEQYRIYNGVTATSRKFTVERLSQEALGIGH